LAGALEAIYGGTTEPGELTDLAKANDAKLRIEARHRVPPLIKGLWSEEKVIDLQGAGTKRKTLKIALFL
jgi:hypothetical protein